MVLDNNSIFPANQASVSDNGNLNVTNSDNLAKYAVITGNILKNSFFATFDDNITTYMSSSQELVSEGDTTGYYFLYDLLKPKNNVVLSTYYSVFGARFVGGQSYTCTLATSLNNTDWTTVDSVTLTAAPTEAFKNYSGLIKSVRYIRFIFSIANYSGTSSHGQRVYNIQITSS